MYRSARPSRRWPIRRPSPCSPFGWDCSTRSESRRPSSSAYRMRTARTISARSRRRRSAAPLAPRSSGRLTHAVGGDRLMSSAPAPEDAGDDIVADLVRYISPTLNRLLVELYEYNRQGGFRADVLHHPRRVRAWHRVDAAST